LEAGRDYGSFAHFFETYQRVLRVAAIFLLSNKISGSDEPTNVSLLMCDKLGSVVTGLGLLQLFVIIIINGK
jgi:hypothetical protein